MSTPSVTAPARSPSARRRRPAVRLRPVARGLIRGRDADPAWSRPLLWLIAGLAGALGLWGLTRNGYGNLYYAEAAQAASRSWRAWITNALDVSGAVGLDKGPLSNMLMGLSGRIFGFSSFTMLLPQALCGVASVLLLHNITRRTLGHGTALVAALMLALTPIFVAMSRFNNPDAVLVLCELAAAWALVRGLESGRTRHLLLCGLFVGLAFNTKMLQAYLIVPGLALTFALAGRGRVRRRVGQLAAGGAVMLLTSFAWYAVMMLLPAADRPWVGDTTNNSWFSLIFGANGLSRVSGNAGGTGPGGPGGGFGGPSGPLRLFNAIVGGQIAWLLPLAVLGLGLGLWTYRRTARTDLRRSAYALWGGWALVSWAVFSFSRGVFHPYYTSALAPAVAVLAGGGLTCLTERARGSIAWSAAAAAAVMATSVLAAVLLGRVTGFVTWLAPAAMVIAALAGAALLIRHGGFVTSRPALRRIVTRLAAGGALLAVLAGPTSYSLATVGRSISGSDPAAGPATAAGAGFRGRPGGPGGSRRAGFRAPPGFLRAFPFAGGPAPAGAFPGGPGARPPAGVGGPGGEAVSRPLLRYLESHQGRARYLVAAVGSSTAGAIALQSGRDVINMGGFMGSDPAPSLTALQRLVGSGQLHYVLLGGGRGGPEAGSATATRDTWIRAHGRLITVRGAGASADALYYLSGRG